MRKVSPITAALVLGLAFVLPSSAAFSHRASAASHTGAGTHAVARGPQTISPATTKAVKAAVPHARRGKRRAHRLPQAIWLPTIGVRARIGRSLARGPIYWRQVGRPGQGTTIAIAGHDVTPVPGFHGHGPFHDINQLHKGDPITVTWGSRRYAYHVTGQRLIPGTNRHIADLTRYERLLLTTCWPRGSSQYRLVVYARPA